MSKLSPIFDGKVENGKLKVYDESALKIWIASLDGKPVTIRVERAINKRSTQQNKFLWGVCYKTICDTFGWDTDDCHEFCKNEFNPKFIEIVDKKTGETEERKIGGSTAKMDTIDFSEYVDKIQRFFAEKGCVIPDAGQIDFRDDVE